MASICNRCALRLQRSVVNAPSNRAFSQSATRSRTVPTFQESSNEELNGLLSNLREKHLIPAYLSDAQRKLIFKPKNRQFLQDNPQTIDLGGEEIQLQWINRERDIPSRKKLVRKALNVIVESQDGKAWENIPTLLQAFKEGIQRPAEEKRMEKIVRKAFQIGKFGSVMKCLLNSHRTGMTLKDEGILRAIVWGFRQFAQDSNWEKASVEKALKDMNSVIIMLETDEHKGGRLNSSDARRSPEIAGTMLELAAVYAYKHAGERQKEANAIVKTYAERLLSLLRTKQDEVTSEKNLYLVERDSGPQWPFLLSLPIHQGLTISHKVLGANMPQPELAQQFIAKYEARLTQLVTELQVRKPKQGTYDELAISDWSKRFQDLAGQ